jgi:predicted HAD superfamily Cof-like phosphohydrolase
MKYGSNTETVEAFLRHLEGMTAEQWGALRVATARQRASTAALDAAREAALDAVDAVGEAAVSDAVDAVRRAVRNAARNVVWNAAWDAAWDAAVYAIYEIIGAAVMRERGQSFYFLPMFGFDSPEAVFGIYELGN